MRCGGGMRPSWSVVSVGSEIEFLDPADVLVETRLTDESSLRPWSQLAGDYGFVFARASC
jgi:hypothetical protein